MSSRVDGVRGRTTFRLMASGDLHWDEHRRFDECLRVHQWIAEEVARQQPDVFLIPGDIYERASTPRERAAVAEWLTALAETCPIVLAKGNHDRALDVFLMGRLHARHPILVEERASVRLVAGAAIAAVAWPDTASIAAMIGRPLASDALDDVAREALRNVLLGLGQELAQHDGPRILMGHFLVDGSKTSTAQPLIGQELSLGLADLALAQAAFVLASHIHCPQEFVFGGAHIVLPGSPYRTSYGETEEKSIVLADFDGPRLARWTRIPTPARPMLLVQGAWVPPQNGQSGELALDDVGQDLLANVDTGSADSAEIRIRYDVDADQQAAARPVAALVRDVLLAHGAADVKLEPMPRAVVRAKAPEVARATYLPDKLKAFWASREAMPEPDRAARLLAKLGQVDGEVDRFEGVSGAIRLERLRFAGFRPYREEVDIDVASLPGQVVAVCGDNGAGKSTMLELVPGALFRRMPTHGGLADMATSRAAFVEATIANGKTWTIRQSIDCEARTGKSLVLDGTGKPAFRGTAVTEYDKWAARHIQPSALFLATSFGAQRAGGFLDMTDGERKAVVLRALGIERYELLAARAGENAKSARSERDRLEGGLKVAQERFGDVDTAAANHAAALAAATEAEAALEQARAAHARKVEATAAYREAVRRRDEAQRVREELDGRLASARSEQQALIARQVDGGALLAQASAIRRAEQHRAESAAHEAELRAELERHEAAAVAAAREAKEARRRAEAALTRKAAAEQRAAKRRQDLNDDLRGAREEHEALDRRVTAERDGLLAHTAAICNAASRLPEVASQQSCAQTEVERLREVHRAAISEANQHAAAAGKEEAAIRATVAPGGALERARRAAATLRAKVSDALTGLDPAREEAATASAEAERWRAKVERLDGIQNAGSNSRIEALRGGYAEILLPAERTPDIIARSALRADDEAAALAVSLPEQRSAARLALAAATKAEEAADRKLGDYERTAEQAPEADVAEAALRELLDGLDAAKASATESRRLEAQARECAAEIAAEGKGAAARAWDLAEEQRALGPIAARAPDLAGAEARIAGWQERIEQLRRDEQRLAEELAAIPSGGGPEADEAEREARAERAAAEDADGCVTKADGAAGAARRALVELATERRGLALLAARAEDLTREEALAPERAIQLDRLSAEIGKLERDIAAIEDVVVPSEPDVAGPEAAMRVADGAAREAHVAVAVAARALEQARAGAEKIKTLVAELFAAEETISDWDRLARDLGRDGLQSAEIDCVGPELSELTNDLLHTCYSTRWTATLRAAKASKDGSRELDGFEARIIDSVDGREADARFFSPGQKALIGEAMANALSIVACRRAGVDGPSLFRDETSSGLDPESARAYVAMLRRVAAAVGANKVFFVSHSEEMKEMADARLEIRDGRVSGPGIGRPHEAGQTSLLQEVA